MIQFLPRKKRRSYTIIIGCGRLGANLANTLSDEGEEALILDKNEESFHRLSPSYGGLSVVGDGMDLEVLRSIRTKQSTFGILFSRQ